MKVSRDLEQKILSLAGVTVPAPPPVVVSEKEFQKEVIKAAKLRGWLEYHVHFSQRSRPGFPDLVLARQRVIFAELKTEDGELTDEQNEWKVVLQAIGGTVDYYVWRPEDWLSILEALK